MPTNIGHFEILNELSKSSTGSVYKANDSRSGQTVALKVVQMSAFGEHAAALEQALLQEAESVKRLSGPNVTTVESASVIDGQFCAAMEYVQGNSIATMLARKEGFSIWDLLDIGRQLSSGLDCAAAQQITHQSLEPSKIMCGWDGTVKILSFGVSAVGNFVQYTGPEVSSILHYMSPEQVRGETTDGRSHIFSVGAMLYEMVTERKAFDREDIEGLRQSILESTPVAPIHVNAKVHPLLSDLIMKALSKDPSQRYQNGRELLCDLEKCKETKPAAKKIEVPKGPVASAAAKAVAQVKFAGEAGAPAKSPISTPGPTSVSAQSMPHWPTTATSHTAKIAPPKAAAAAVGIGSNSAPVQSPQKSEVVDTDVPAAQMSAAVANETQVETFEPRSAPEAPKIAVDPLMAEGPSNARGGTSFSEIAELPPLKEVYVAPPPPPPVETEPTTPIPATAYRGAAKTAEKPKVQPRQVATKAIKEIKGVPPKLMFYSLAGAGALILAIAAGVVIYIHSQNGDDDSGAKRAAVASTQLAQTPAQPAEAQPAPAPQPQDSTAASPAPEEAQPQEISEPQATPVQRAAPVRARNARKKTAAPAFIPGQLAIDSVPQGAQVQVDGQGDPSWVTPFTLANLQPGAHSISVSKAGYSTDTRSVTVVAATRGSAIVHLQQMMATLAVKSDPPGANVYIDGHDSGTKTPAQISVNKGQHVVLVRMSGYLDETMTGQFVLGQSLSFSPTLRALGNVDNMRTVGKMSKLFHKGGQEGQGTISIHTQPKGADIAINRHMVEKTSPTDVMLDPGNYLIDITMTGYAPVHKIVTVTSEKGAKVVVDEVLQPQQ